MDDKNSLYFLGAKIFSNKNKDVDKKPKETNIDVSAPGLHIMHKKSSFSSSNSDLSRLKERWKNHGTSEKDKKGDNSSTLFRRMRSHSKSPSPEYKKRHRSRSQKYKRSDHSRSPGHRCSDRSKSPGHRRSDRCRSPSYKDSQHSASTDCKYKDLPKSSDSRHFASNKHTDSDNHDGIKHQKSKNKSQNDSKSRCYGDESSSCSLNENKGAAVPDSVETSNLQADEKTITDDDINSLSARIIKAEMLGNQAKVDKLKLKLKDMKKKKDLQRSKNHGKTETVILTTTDRKGNVRPLDIPEGNERGKRKREKLCKTHSSNGSRERYFPDDDAKSLDDLIRNEKLSSKPDESLMLKYAGKLSKMSQGRRDYTLDDMFVSNIAKTVDNSSKDRNKSLAENLKEHKRNEMCVHCIEKVREDSIVHIGKTLYVRVPLYKSLTRYHCQIVPAHHTVSSIHCDEDFLEEYKNCKYVITEKVKEFNYDVVFMEMAKNLGQRKHVVIDCVPVPRDDASMLPAYFKKAIQECDVEWSNNKKLIDTSTKGLHKSVPIGMPFFSIEFGVDGGYAHVLEEEKYFSRYFGLEIVGGVLEAAPNLWRNPEKETPEGLRYKVNSLKNKFPFRF